MRHYLRSAALGGVTLLLAAPSAAQFQVADLLFVPVVSSAVGENESQWASDVYIMNVDETPVDVAIGFLPSGLFSNASRFGDRSGWLGGREDDGFGLINEQLADIPPGGSVALTDIKGTYWPENAGTTENGALVVFIYEADTLEPDGTRVFRNGVVSSRTYNQGSLFTPDPDNEGEFIETPATYGQTIPAVPWYNLAFAEELTEDSDLSSHVLLGGIETEDYRYNIGILNTSDPQTQISLRLQPFQQDGSPFLDANENEVQVIIVVPPLAHLQYSRALLQLFALNPETQDLSNISVKISWVGWETAGIAPVPTFTSYGSVVDDVSNDPTSVLPSFLETYPLDCVWFDTGAGGGATVKARPRPSVRSVEIPSL